MSVRAQVTRREALGAFRARADDRRWTGIRPR